MNLIFIILFALLLALLAAPHANEIGEQLLSNILMAFFKP